MPQTSTLLLKFKAKQTSILDLSRVVDTIDLDFSQFIGNGTGAGQANQIWHDRRTVNNGANEDLDMAGALTNVFGVTLTFTKIRLVILFGAKANTGNLTVTRPASNGLPLFLAAGDGFPLKPGGVFLNYDPSTAGIAVTAGTGDLINIANASGASQSYDVVIGGIV